MSQSTLFVVMPLLQCACRKDIHVSVRLAVAENFVNLSCCLYKCRNIYLKLDRHFAITLSSRFSHLPSVPRTLLEVCLEGGGQIRYLHSGMSLPFYQMEKSLWSLTPWLCVYMSYSLGYVDKRVNLHSIAHICLHSLGRNDGCRYCQVPSPLLICCFISSQDVSLSSKMLTDPRVGVTVSDKQCHTSWLMTRPPIWPALPLS